MPLNRARTFAVVCVLALVGLASPASAGIRADFDRDGLADNVTLIAGARPHIRIVFSGTGQLVLLPLQGHLESLVAADVDRDGFTDLAGTSKRRDLFLWRNSGGSGVRGFVPMRPRVRRHLLDSLILTVGEPRLGHESPDDGAILVALPAGDGKHIALPHAAFIDSIPLASIAPRTRPLLSDAALSRSASSRAPPLHSL